MPATIYKATVPLDGAAAAERVSQYDGVVPYFVSKCSRTN